MGERLSAEQALRTLKRNRHVILAVTLAGTLAAVAYGGYRYWRQPVSWSASLQFRLTFDGADGRRYPNGLQFGLQDITAPSVLDEVYDRNGIQAYCDRDAFRGAFFIEETSTDIQFLDMEYLARLSDARLTAVDRERIQAEYRGRRDGLAHQYKLTFVRPAACRRVPNEVALKVLSDVLSGWAEESENRRGVLRIRVPILTPATLDVAASQAPLIRIDLVRTALVRIIRNIGEVAALPGAAQLRHGNEQVTFAEIRARLEDLVQAEIEPLLGIVAAGIQMPETIRWVDEVLQSANLRRQAAQNRVEASRTALREYSGMTLAPGTKEIGRGDEGRAAGAPVDVQSLTPTIDSTFVERIVQMSAANVTFRQQLTRDIITSAIETIDEELNANRYRRLAESLRRSGARALSPAEIDERIARIVEEGKSRIRDFNAMYDELSRVSLRAGPMMYATEKPSEISVTQPLSLRRYGLIVLAAFGITLLVMAAAVVGYAFWRQAAEA